MRSLSLRFRACLFGLVSLLPVSLFAAAPAEQRVQAHLAAGEFGPARQLVDSLPNQQTRDQWLGRIAQAQVETGARWAAARTAYDIAGEASRGQTFSSLAQHPLGGSGARGGAALADFDSLIELITTTVEPDSWDTIGGPGAIESFPTGVYVDPTGLMKMTATPDEAETLRGIRRASYRDVGNRDLHRTSALRKVSLTRLERHVQMRSAMGQPPTDAMLRMAGLHDVQYVLLFPETRDIVLAGPAGGWKEDSYGRHVNVTTGTPVLALDDLVVVLRNAFSDKPQFGCAITPSREGLAGLQEFLRASAEKPLRKSRRAAWLRDLRAHLGEQAIEVFGIDPRTRAARLIVEADYHMKLVGMGLQEGVPGVKSYLKTVTLDEDGRPPAMDVLRWWFTLNYRGLVGTEARDAFRLVGDGVKVQSENELLGEGGSRIHTGTSDELNQRFAQSFTKNFDMLAAKYPVYAELRNLFDMSLVAAIVRSHGFSDRIDWQFSHFRDPERYAVELSDSPERVESVINHRELGRKHLVVGVSGGVQVDASKLVAATRWEKHDQALNSVQAGSVPDSIASDVWWWD